MKKPMNCTFPDCIYCPYQDCKYDEIEQSDLFRQNAFDNELGIVDPKILRRRQSQKKYINSEKGKLAMRRYLNSEKGQENERRKRQKKIDNGKNAEYCRRYYRRKKLEIMEQK